MTTKQRLAVALGLAVVFSAVLGATWLVLLLGLPAIAWNTWLLSEKHRAELAPYGSLRPPPPDAAAPTLPTPGRRRSTSASARDARGLRS